MINIESHYCDDENAMIHIAFRLMNKYPILRFELRKSNDYTLFPFVLEVSCNNKILYTIYVKQFTNLNFNTNGQATTTREDDFALF